MTSANTLPTCASILAELKSKGSERTRKTYARHGVPLARSFGVSVADLKLMAKQIRGQQALALELYASGNFESMYLAGMIAHGSKMTVSELHSWAHGAAGLNMISEYTVPWVAVEHPRSRELAMQWIDSHEEHVAASGWCTYSGMVVTTPDAELDLAQIETLLARVVTNIHGAQNRVRYTMNSFLISVSTYVQPLTDAAKAAAIQIGAVSVEMGDTACKVPSALACIEKAATSNRPSIKRKTIRC